MVKKGEHFFGSQKVGGYRTGQLALTEGNVEKLFEHITDLYRLGLFKLAISGGIRREDVVAVKCSDVDVQNKVVTFYENKKRRIKSIHVSQEVINLLQIIININKKSGAIYLFPSKINNKKHISGKTAYNWFQEQLDMAGLKKRPFHALRATCIKLCQKKGWTPAQTAELVGDTIRVIQEHYEAPSEDEMRTVAEEKAII